LQDIGSALWYLILAVGCTSLLHTNMCIHAFTGWSLWCTAAGC
jgi:hypothetical protein